MRRHFSRFWNIIDLLSILFFIISIIFKETLSKDYFFITRLIFSFTIALFYIKFLNIFYAFKTIGPLLLMLVEMLKDLGRFLAILIVFITMFGVMSTSLRFPEREFTLQTLRRIFYESYFNIYAELFLENYDKEFGESCNNTEFGDNPCPKSTFFAFILFAIFLLIGNVLMINLLIAKFTNSIDRVLNDSKMFYYFLRFELVNEYSHKTILFPFLSIIPIIFSFFCPVHNSFYENIFDEENQENNCCKNRINQESDDNKIKKGDVNELRVKERYGRDTCVTITDKKA